MEIDSKYLFKVRPGVNKLPLNDLYTIRTNTDIEESLRITVGQYRELRDLILSSLQNYYTKTEYKHADILSPYLLVRCYIGKHICMQVFHIKEWLIIREEFRFDQEMDKKLEWGKWCYERTGNFEKVNIQGRLRR